ncbi:hypothetical protein ACHHYP_20190 [Achlya hypogyna]|uniref:Uncharacterized protein n=1 Tax=Achlya hypogyna TaxID=1202772 RepID=A0A1V9YZY6_ACHHY|nr:hypothetical protein ACHHYP_20190 [Achlya hypogyna]
MYVNHGVCVSKTFVILSGAFDAVLWLLENGITDLSSGPSNALFAAAIHRSEAHCRIVQLLLEQPFAHVNDYVGRLTGDGLTPTLLHYVSYMASPVAAVVLNTLLDDFHADIDVVDLMHKWQMPLPPLHPLPPSMPDAAVSAIDFVPATRVDSTHVQCENAPLEDDNSTLDSSSAPPRIATVDSSSYHSRDCWCRNGTYFYESLHRLRDAVLRWHDVHILLAHRCPVFTVADAWRRLQASNVAKLSDHDHIRLKLFVLHWKQAKVMFAFYRWKSRPKEGKTNK